MPNTPDGVYSNRPWIAKPEAAYPPQAYIGPFASNQEQNLSQAMAALTMPAAELQEYVRPNLPQIQLFPPRYGYVQTAYGIEDMIDISTAVSARIGDGSSRLKELADSPNPAGQAESSSRNTLGWGV